MTILSHRSPIESTVQGPLAVVAIVIFGMVSVAAAAPKVESAVRSEVRLRIVVPSLAEVENKLKWLIERSPDPQFSKQWKKLKRDLIESFTDGVDENQPFSLDIVFPAEGLSYELRVPISDLTGEKAGFLQGLRGRSYKVKELGDGSYEIRAEHEKPAHLKYDKNYAWIVTGDHPVPTSLPSATKDLLPLIALKKDVVAQIVNDAEGMTSRRETFQSACEQLQATGRKRRNESQKAFELRQVVQKFLLNEAEPFLVEAEKLQLNWTVSTSAPRPVGRVELSLTALPGTDLLQMIEQVATKPSYFANVKRHQNPIAVAKLTVPVDALQIKHFKDFCQSLRPILESDINARTTPSKSQKEAMVRVVNTLIDLVEEGTELKTVDVFAEMFASAEKKNTFLFGVRSAKAKKGDEIVKLVPSAFPEWHVKLNAHEQSGVSIHELAIGPKDLALFQSLFGEERVIYVATGQDVIWGAAGAESLKHLKSAIEQAAMPAPVKIEQDVFSYHLHVGKCVSLLESVHKQVSSRNKSPTADQRQTQKEIDKYLKVAHAAMTNCDSMMGGELKRIDNRIEGSTELSECVLRCLGSILGVTAKDLE